ncbi:MAG: hypothetical protein ABGX04_18750 [Myxococcales bacterium]
MGTKLEVAYYDQLRTALDLEKTVIENLAGGQEYVDIGGERRHVIGYLQDFLFSPDRARTPMKALSGGEHNRLLLAQLFAQGDRTYKLGSGITSEYGRYAKSLGEPVTGLDLVLSRSEMGREL